MENLARLPWVGSYDQTLVSAPGPLRHMRAQGVEPHVEVSVEGFLAVPSLIAGTDRVAFMHERLARRFADLAEIRILPSPLPSEEHLAVLYWDPNATNDPGHRWFRDVLVRAAASVDAESTASDLLLR